MLKDNIHGLIINYLLQWFKVNLNDFDETISMVIDDLINNE